MKKRKLTINITGGNDGDRVALMDYMKTILHSTGFDVFDDNVKSVTTTDSLKKTADSTVISFKLMSGDFAATSKIAELPNCCQH